MDEIKQLKQKIEKLKKLESKYKDIKK